jgi:hypothetical protein
VHPSIIEENQPTGAVLSHDQRPGRLRVVQDSAKPAAGRRAGDNAAATGASAKGVEIVQAGAAGAAGTAGAAGAAIAAKPRLPLLQAALFLVACAIGGVAIALVRPFGIG